MTSLFGRGFLTIARFRGAPVRLHWTLPIGAFYFTGASFVPGAWLGFALLVLVHELGHAVLVHRFGLTVEWIDVYGFGGTCRWSGAATARRRAIVAWGGVLAQAVLLVATFLATRWISPPSSFWAELASTLITTNLVLIGLNLLPFAPLDGAEAWKLFWMKRRPRPSRDASPRARPVEHEAARVRALEEELARMRALEKSDEEVFPMPPELRKLLAEILERERTSSK